MAEGRDYRLYVAVEGAITGRSLGPVMDTPERNRRIYQLHKGLHWTCQDIGELMGISRQRVHQIVQQLEGDGIIQSEVEIMQQVLDRIDTRTPRHAITCHQAARKYGVHYSTLNRWVNSGRIRVLLPSSGPGRAMVLDEDSVVRAIKQHRLCPNKGGRPPKNHPEIVPTPT